MKRMLIGLMAAAVAQPGLAAQAQQAEEKEDWVRVVEERQGYGPPETGGDWFRVARSQSGTIHFIDRSSIRKKGRFLTAWEKQDTKADKELDSREALALHLYDCAAGSAAMMEVHVYRHDGSKEGTIYTDPEKVLKPVKDGTVGLPLLAYVCVEGGFLTDPDLRGDASTGG